MKQSLFLFVLISIGINGYSQKEKKSQLAKQSYITNFQRLSFITLDSTYSFTKFIEQNGEFYFNYGFEDSSYSFGGVKIDFGKSNRNSNTSELKFKYIHEIDTLYCQFISKGKNNYKRSPNDLIDDLKASYILRQLKEKVIDNSSASTIRLIEPLDEMNFSNYYRIYNIFFFTDSAKLSITLGRSIDNQGMQIVKKDTRLLRKRDIDRIRKQLTKINSKMEGECRQPGNPCILEFNNNEGYKRYIYSEICFNHHSNIEEKKFFDPVVNLEILLKQYAMKYLNISHLSIP